MIISGVPALPFDDSTEFTAPPAFGPFRVLHQIGSGALGPVFRTFEPREERLVAVKAFRLDIVPEAAERVADGLRQLVAAWPEHPALVSLVDAGLEGTTPFLASEYVAADTLDLSLRQTSRARIEVVLPVLQQLADAIEAAWAAGLGHGALHPRDIFVHSESGGLTLTGGEIRVTGFGVVPLLESLKIGVPGRRPYSAPERADGSPWDIKADTYSLGVIAHEFLTGRRPTDPRKLDDDALRGVPRDRRVAVRRVLAAALDADPGRRFSTPTALVDALAWGDSPDAEEMGAAPSGEAGRPREENATVVLSPRRAPVPKEARPPAIEPVAEPPSAPAVERSVEPPAPRPAARSAKGGSAGRPVEPPVEPPVESPADAPIGPLFEPSRPAADVPPPAPARATVVPPPLVVAPPPSAPSPSYGVVALVAVITLVGGLGLGYWWRGSASAPASTSGLEAGGEVPIGTEVAVTEPPAPIEEEPLVTNPAPVPPSPAGAGRAQAARTPAATVAPDPVPEAASGRVLVRSVPDGADVTVDGRSHGKTPAAIRDLPFGEHVIAVARPGYLPGTARVSLSQAIPARDVTIELQAAAVKSPGAATGSVLVETRPAGARVVIDGRVIGVTPLRVPDLKPGPHTVRLELAGHRTISTTVDVRSGQQTPLRVSMEVG